MSTNNWTDNVQFNSDGLIAAIAQEASSGKVLMLAWMNLEALQETVRTKTAVYWSRSRQKLWYKGEESGHTQLVEEIRLDCDGDAILLLVKQQGGIACHTGRHSCFYQKLISANNHTGWQNADPVLKPPSQIYK